MRRKTPSIQDLMTKTGRSEQGIYEVLSTLQHERYIQWSKDNPEVITLLEAWERSRKSLHQQGFY
jgi:DNA-binding IclR family transcriptional regulator